MTATLPPMPDPETGEPRPPSAVTEAFAGKPKRHGGDDRIDPASVSPPEGKGPTLEAYRTSTRTAFTTAATIAVILFVAACVMSWAKMGNPVDWMSTWWMWLIIVAFSGLMLLGSRGKSLAAGADWVMRDGKSWVETYRLTKVKLGKYAGGYTLDLTDRTGRKFTVNLYDIQSSPWVWDLVYNGIRHSIASGGVTTNKIAVNRLQLPDQQSTS